MTNYTHTSHNFINALHPREPPPDTGDQLKKSTTRPPRKSPLIAVSNVQTSDTERSPNKKKKNPFKETNKQTPIFLSSIASNLSWIDYSNFITS